MQKYFLAVSLAATLLIGAPTSSAQSSAKEISPDEVGANLEGKPVKANATLKKNGKIFYLEFGQYVIDGCDNQIKGKRPNSAVTASGILAEYSEGGMGQMAAPPSFTLNNCRLADQADKSTAAPAASIVTVLSSSNPAIDSWMKTCMPFSKPMDMERQIQNGKVDWNGVTVKSVSSADGGSNSVIAVTLDQSLSDFKAKHAEFGKKVKLPKNKSCPLGIERSTSEKSITGAKGATVECNCSTGGD